MRFLTISLLGTLPIVCLAADNASVRDAVADPFENICIPQIASGGGWKTTITLVNMNTRDGKFSLLLSDVSGNDLSARFITPTGVVTTSELSGVLPVNGSVTYETVDTGRLQQFWALLLHNGIMGVDGTIAGHAIFQQQTPGRPAFEAVAPLSTFAERRVRLPFDNTNSFQTGVAVVNTDTVQATISGRVYNEKGELLGDGNFTLPILGQRAFVLSDVFGSAKNVRGMIELSTSARAMCSIGLRFHPGGAFTSTPPLSLPGW